MKKKYYLIPVLGVILSLSACILPEDFDDLEYELSDLYGEWQSGTEHYIYYENGTGLEWDTADDVTRDEAQRFRWTLDATDFRLCHEFESSSAEAWSAYTLTELTSTTLEYNDFFDFYSFTKVGSAEIIRSGTSTFSGQRTDR